MRRLPLAMLVLSGLLSAQTLIGHNFGNSSTSTEPPVTVTWSGTANLIYIECVSLTSNLITPPTDTLNLTWHSNAANSCPCPPSDPNIDVVGWYAYGSFSGGTDTITCAYTGNASSLMVQVWKGTLTSSDPADGSVSHGFTGYSGSLTPSQAGDVFISGYLGYTGAGDCSTASIGTIVNNGYLTGVMSWADAYYINTGTSAVEEFWTCADDADNDSAIAAFKTPGNALPSKMIGGSAVFGGAGVE